VHTFNIANPATPHWLGAVGPFYSTAVTMSDSNACAVSHQGLTILDVSQPAEPRIAGQYETENLPGGVAFRDGIAFLASDHGLDIVDVKDPLQPRRLHFLEYGSGTVFGSPSVDLVGRFAYVTSYGSWTILDVSDPENPLRLGAVPTTGIVMLVRARGQLALTYEYAHTNDEYREYVTVFSLVDPANPVRMGSFEVDDGIYAIDIDGPWGYLVTTQGLAILDLRTPASPRMAARVALDGGPQGVTVLDGIAYVAAGTTGLIIIDVSDPERPLIVGTGSVGGGASSRSAALVGSTAFVADGLGGLQLLDVSDPAHPVARGDHVTNNYVVDVRFQGGLVFTVEQQGRWDQGSRLRILRPDGPDPTDRVE
jgi:hypothetical protein